MSLLKIFKNDWKNALTVRNKYETVIFASFQKAEQRRAVRTIPLLEGKYNAMLFDDDAKEFLSREQSIIYVPLEFEKFTGTRGSLKVTASTSIANFFYLKYAQVYIVDEDENRAKVTSVSGSDVNLATNISGTSTSFYTAIKAYSQSYPISAITGDVIGVSVDWKQILE